jgi:hypothetical protein
MKDGQEMKVDTKTKRTKTVRGRRDGSSTNKRTKAYNARVRVGGVSYAVQRWLISVITAGRHWLTCPEIVGSDGPTLTASLWNRFCSPKLFNSIHFGEWFDRWSETKRIN